MVGKFYDQSIVPAELRRNYEVYDRIKQAGVDLGTFEQNVGSLKGRGIAGAVIHESGLVYLSGVGTGKLPMNDDPERVQHGQEAGREAADHQISVAIRPGLAEAIIRNRGWVFPLPPQMLEKVIAARRA